MPTKHQRRLLSVCGLYCGECSIHLRTDEELSYWRSKNVDLDKVRCDGCRSPRKEGTHWSHDCGLVACCINRKRLEFCALCPDLESCQLVKEFAASFEHHRQAVDRLREMRRTGVEQWLTANGYT